MSEEDKLKLQGFNNLTKTLSFNTYNIVYTSDKTQQQRYIEHIDSKFNAKSLTDILSHVSQSIGANILNVATQDYEPQGASVTLLVSDGSSSVVGHLDKSHITVHTYPEHHPKKGISTFRADIEVSTCGLIPPLTTLNYLLENFDSDIAIMDYRVRGFERDENGEKFFIDHEINSIQEFIPSGIKDAYESTDINMCQENVFHTRMMRKAFDMKHYQFGEADKGLSSTQEQSVSEMLRQEMAEIFYGKNME